MADYHDVAEAVLQLLDNGKDESAIVASVAEYLVNERKTRDLDRIMREVGRLRRERYGLVEVVASSPRPLSAEIKQEIKRLYDAKNVKVITEIDESLVGGVRLRTLDAQLDLSVRGQLSRLKNSNF